jgi:ABC-type glycerol-3-phosphate transport system substrate-binding protein
LAKAGVKPPSADPKSRITWEQLSADAAKAKGAGGTQYGLVFGQWDRYYQLQPLPMSLGGGNGAAPNDPLKPEVTTPQWVKAFDWYGKQFADGTSPRGIPTEQNDALFAAGKIAYMVEGPWLLPQLSKAKVDWGVAAHPMFAGGKPVTPTGSWSLALNPYSKNKPAAGVFLKWMAIDGGSGYTTNLPSPELPANVKGKAAYFARPVFATPEGKKAAAIIDYETANTAVNRVPTVGFIEFEDIIGRAFADIRNGTPAKTALDKAQADINTAWAKYR